MVLDLDGVISDASHRQHFLAPERSRDKDWHGFFHACVDDAVIPHGRALADAVDATAAVVILTARVHEVRDQTVAWLAANQIRHDWLILRGPGEGAPSGTWKRARLEALREAGATIDDPWLCSSSIGAGGNLLEALHRLRGVRPGHQRLHLHEVL